MEEACFFRPIVIDWEITYKCNFNCNFCYLKKESDIAESEIDNILEEIAEIRPFEVKIGGGEPLLVKKRIEKICKRLFSTTQLTLVTNGSLITQNNISLITKYFKNIQVSLHSLSETKYSLMCNTSEKTFDLVLSNILKLKDENINVVINFVLNNQNYTELGDVMQFCENNSFSLRILRYRGYNYCLDGELDLIKSYLNKDNVFFDDGFNLDSKKICGAIKNVLAVDPSGKVYPCTWLRKKYLGDLKNETLRNILSKQQTVILRNRLVSLSKNNTEQCPYFLY